MTAQEQAKYFLRKLQYAKLFELLELNLNEENTHSTELFTLQDLKDRFVAGDIDRRFPQQVRIFLNAHIAKIQTSLPTQNPPKTKSRLAYLVGVVLVLLGVLYWFGVGKVNEPETPKKPEVKKEVPKDSQNFHILIVPFLDFCEYKGKSYNAGKAIQLHLEHITARDKLSITVAYLAGENIQDFTDKRAETLRQTHHADMVIYGVYQTSACSAKGDQICLNYITDKKWGLGDIGTNLDKERFAQGGLEELKTGKVQEKVENIALFVSVLAQVKNIDHSKYMKLLQGVLDKNIDAKLRAQIFFELGDIFTKEGKYEGAYLHHQKAIAIYQQEKDDYMVLVLLERIGDYYLTIGKAEEALRYYQQALEIAEKRYKQNTTDVYRKKSLSISQHQIGNIYKAIGKHREALTYQQQYLKLCQELYITYPKNTSFKEGLVKAFLTVGISYEDLKEFQKALPYFEQSLKMSEELCQDYPDIIAYQHILSVAYSRMAMIYGKVGKPEESFALCQKNVQIAEKICQAKPHNVTFKNDLGLDYNLLGTYYYNYKKDKAQAKIYCQKAQQIFKELVQNSPESVDFQRRLKMVEANLANL